VILVSSSEDVVRCKHKLTLWSPYCPGIVHTLNHVSISLVLGRVFIN
jgi:hypothetical protein